MCFGHNSKKLKQNKKKNSEKTAKDANGPTKLTTMDI